MNYQLMFQTVAQICGLAVVVMFFVTIAVYDKHSKNRRTYVYWTALLFLITLITGALAAGLS